MRVTVKQQMPRRSVVLVGLMGAGKSTVGKRLATRLGMDFFDSDAEIERAAGSSIAHMFADYGEDYFRDGEQKVIKRLLEGPPIVLATGGGAFMSAPVRDEVAKNAVSVWLRAELNTLWDRVKGKPGRPLLDNPDPKAVLKSLIKARYPVYETADVIVDSAPGCPHEAVVDAIIAGLQNIKEK